MEKLYILILFFSSIFVQNELLPIFLLDEVNTLPVIKEKEEKNEIKIEEKKEGENNKKRNTKNNEKNIFRKNKQHIKLSINVSPELNFKTQRNINDYFNQISTKKIIESQFDLNQNNQNENKDIITINVNKEQKKKRNKSVENMVYKIEDEDRRVVFVDKSLEKEKDKEKIKDKKN